MAIEKINTKLAGLPPAWMSRATQRPGAMAHSAEIKKILGEPIPQEVDPKLLSPKIAEFFRRNGTLERLRKKLSLISKKKGGRFIPARNTIAAVDEDDNVYVGVEFLERFGDDEDLIAAIISHEWGHMLSDRRNIDWSHLSWDELHAMRRDEEGEADGFAGRALFFMGYATEQMIDFLHLLDRTRKNKKLPQLKYHNTPTRVEILKQSFEAAKRSMEIAHRIFGKNGPKIGKILGAG
ncbi:MAG: hypothetical protein HY540_02690 [Deltaproteobacteria bacterium]|nr:hypothetical protein [Deltaproteobacteria bacterium]